MNKIFKIVCSLILLGIIAAISIPTMIKKKEIVEKNTTKLITDSSYFINLKHDTL